MNRVAIAFSTKDRVELSKRTVEPLLQPDKFDLLWFDGSTTKEGEDLPLNYGKERVANCVDHLQILWNIRGGADAAIVKALTYQLKHPNNYTHIGLVENDVLITGPDRFDKTMALFEQGERDGLKVGAVSARCYEDRILIQRPDYAICHNLGAGMVIFTREAAELVLKNFRTGWTHANRLLFAQLSGIDIGAYWAFRGGQHSITADWHFDAVLAAHGLASLALVPSPVEMIGQVPPLEEQGLTLATAPVAERIDDATFSRYVHNLNAIRKGFLQPAWPGLFQRDPQGVIIYPHQMQYLQGEYRGNWILRWVQGYGPFSYVAGEGAPILTVPVLGPCEVLVGGGRDGGKVWVVDMLSGFKIEPDIASEQDANGQVLSLIVPGSAAYRPIEITMLTPGTGFYGLRCREQQPSYLNHISFEHSWLPPVA